MASISSNSNIALSVDLCNWSEKGHGELVVFLNLGLFKKFKCGIDDAHDHKLCIFYHNDGDKIRQMPLFPNLCTYFMLKMRCPLADQC